MKYEKYLSEVGLNPHTGETIDYKGDMEMRMGKKKTSKQDNVLSALLNKIDNNIKELKANKKKFPEFSKAFDTLIGNFKTTKKDLLKDIQNAKKKGVNIDIKI